MIKITKMKKKIKSSYSFYFLEKNDQTAIKKRVKRWTNFILFFCFAFLKLGNEFVRWIVSQNIIKLNESFIVSWLHCHWASFNIHFCNCKCWTNLMIVDRMNKWNFNLISTAINKRNVNAIYHLEIYK